MCGIAGALVTPNSRCAVDHVQRALARLQHRGPDDHGLQVLPATPTFDHRIILGHQRLSIIDLTAEARQPMRTEDGAYWIVYNGEIYNYLELRAELQNLGHSFRTQSDTEVLLQAWQRWKEQALSKLVGMFAFALVDVAAREMVLARDGFGMKPLYYAVGEFGLVFASEIPALLEMPGPARDINPSALQRFLATGITDDGDSTLFREVQQVPAGKYVKVGTQHPESVAVHRFWELPDPANEHLGREVAIERLRESFLSSVRLHLRSDVAVGTCLSGGMDSSSVLGAMRHLCPDREIHAFTYVAGEGAISEEPWADCAGTSANATMHKLRLTPQEFAQDFDELMRMHDQPIGTIAIYAQYRIFQMAHKAGIKVVLDGQGADELLGGYQRFITMRLRQLVREKRYAEAWNLQRKAEGMGAYEKPQFLRRMLLAPLRRLRRPHAAKTQPIIREQWFADRKTGSVMPSTPASDIRSLQRQMLSETSLPALLRYQDRSSMAHSVESRLPFLTPDIASQALSMPEHYLIDEQGYSKAIFRRAMAGIVPAEILERREKIGFAVPIVTWLQSLQPWVDARIHRCAELPFLNGEFVSRHWEQVRGGKLQTEGACFLVWRMIGLLGWMEAHQPTIN